MARTPTTDIPLGFQAADFALLDVVTGAMSNQDNLMASGPTVVVFMCNHCPFVVHILPEFVAFAKEYMARGVNVLAIRLSWLLMAPVTTSRSAKSGA